MITQHCGHDATIYDSMSRRTYCEGCGASWLTPFTRAEKRDLYAGLRHARESIDRLAITRTVAFKLVDVDWSALFGKAAPEILAAKRQRADEEALWAARSHKAPVSRDMPTGVGS